VAKSRWTIIAGKYISEASLAQLQQLLSQGAKLLFPFGVPQYTERLNQIQWEFSKTAQKDELRIHHRGAGRVYEPAKSLSVSDALVEDVQRLAQQMEQSRD
jgi:hypothetical protein